MPLHKETRVLPYTAEDMYAVVADIERYPEFLPWCREVTIREKSRENGVTIVVAGMAIAYRGLKEHYVSRVRLDPRSLSIEAAHVEGPFRKLDTRWRFVPLSKGSEVHFLIDFAFKSSLLSAIANVAFGYVASRMAESFMKRADALYGSERAKQQV